MTRLVIIFVTVLLCRTGNWLFDTFGSSLNIEQIFFHIHTGFGALEAADTWIFKSFLKNLLFFSFLLSLGVFLAWHMVPTSYRAKRLIFFIPLPFLALGYLLNQLDTGSYVISLWGQDHFSSTYRDPKNLVFKMPLAPKNLILIYVESLENHFKNASVHGENLIKILETLPGNEVSDFIQAPGTGYTIAALVASQCAIPLKGHRGMGTEGLFMPNLLCLGDVLSRFNYQQYFLVGPELKFQGMDKFFLTHGYQHLMGREQWKDLRIPDKHFSSWGTGLSDDALFDQALLILKKISKANNPFNLTILTSDSHAPEGWPSDQCLKEKTSIGYRKTFQCSTELVTKFIHEAEKLGALSNSLVVLMGDHLFHNARNQKDLFSYPSRTIYFKLKDIQFRPFQRQKITHFDVAPTILDSLGIMETPGEQFGLGLSLFTDDSFQQKHHDSLLAQVLTPKILNSSRTYNSFWFGTTTN